MRGYRVVGRYRGRSRSENNASSVRMSNASIEGKKARNGRPYRSL